MPSGYNPEETSRDWETLQQDTDSKTQRLRIKGGWLYRTVTTASQHVALAFVSVHDESIDD